jgi:hypothetical protein
MLANDWEIVEKLPETVSFREAINAILDGKTIQRLGFMGQYHAKSQYSSLQSRLVIHHDFIETNDWIILD